MIPAGLKQWLAFGSGVGIQIDGPRGAESLHVAAVKVRPNGARLLAHYSVEDFPRQPAGVWGTDYAAFVKKYGLQHVVASVILPRSEVIVRLLSLPGVSDKDLAGAIQFQMDGLHPYNEEDVLTGWARLPGTASVLVSIARRDAVERYTTLFAEAGIKVGLFTSSAAVIYSALRLFGKTQAASVLAYEPTWTSGVEIYGESASRPILSATFDTTLERAAGLASAELRLEQTPEVQTLEIRTLAQLLGAAPALPFAAAMTAACPRHALPLNLLPADLRQSNSPMAWVPSAALGAAVVLLAGGLAAFPYFEERRYRTSLEAEIAKVQPGVARANALDRQISTTQKRTALLDDFRKRSKADMDAIAELTRILPPPAWLNLLELNARQVSVAGEIDQAAPLLRMLDSSPLFVSSEFNIAPVRIASPDGTRAGEAFRVRTNREETR